MEKIDKKADKGFSVDILQKARTRFLNAGFENVELHDLSRHDLGQEKASILIIRRGIESMIVGEIDELFDEQKALGMQKRLCMDVLLTNMPGIIYALQIELKSLTTLPRKDEL